MKKKIVILGSTGSIGKATFNVIKNNQNDFKIILLTTNKNTRTQYNACVGVKRPAKKAPMSPSNPPLVAKYVAMVPGNITMENANIRGIIPAEFILKGM